MPIRFFCAKCQFRLRTPDETSGMRIICSRCGHGQIVPQNTDPAAEKASLNRRAFLASQSAKQQGQAGPDDSAMAYLSNTNNQPIRMIVDDEEDVFMAEIAEDEAARQETEEDADNPLAALGQAVAHGPQAEMPDLSGSVANHEPTDGTNALAGLAQQVIASPASTGKPTPAKTGAKPSSKPAPKPAAKKPATYLTPVQTNQPAFAARKTGRVPKLIVWACRLACVAGIPAAVKVGLVTNDLLADSGSGLAAGTAVGMVAVLCLAAGEIAESL